VEVAMANGENGGKLDRELNELLQELRVALPGVQVLFAFLLTIPFAQRFTIISGAQKTAYFIAFLSTAVATAFLIAPSAYHRIQWRQRDKERILRTSTVFTLLGLVFLTAAIVSTVFVVTDVLYDTAWAVVTAVAAGVVFALCWFVLPAGRRVTRRS
jgi:predicted neutral ceramidase superfamily lipid hydrolase